jgi:hypothetical protein
MRFRVFKRARAVCYSTSINPYAVLSVVCERAEKQK